MTRLPNADRARLDIRKLVDYCLNDAHPLGRNKARVFRASLGISSSDAQWLREIVLRDVVLA